VTVEPWQYNLATLPALKYYNYDTVTNGGIEELEVQMICGTNQTPTFGAAVKVG
jgi:hypothetical protein